MNDIWRSKRTQSGYRSGGTHSYVSEKRTEHGRLVRLQRLFFEVF